MPNNGKVFISHTHDDNDLCIPLLVALDAWGVDYWFDIQRMEAGDVLSSVIQRAIQDRDIFIRVCTAAATRSLWMDRECDAFLGLQSRDHKEGMQDKRRLIPLRLDASYVPRPFELGVLCVEAANRPRREWFADLRRALGVEVMLARSGASPISNEANSTSVMPTPASPAMMPEVDSRLRRPEGNGPQTLTVDAFGKGTFTTISAAVDAALPGDTIAVSPGMYEESVRLTKSVEVCGLSKRADVIITGARRVARVDDQHDDEDAVLYFSSPRGRVSNVTVASAYWEGVRVVHGRLILEGCDITAASIGVEVSGAVASCLLRDCRVHGCDSAGVAASKRGRIQMERCEIVGNRSSGLFDTHGGAIDMVGCQVHDNGGCRVSVSFGDSIHIEASTITHNEQHGISLKQVECAIQGNEIHRNGYQGIYIDYGVHGTLQQNDVRGNDGGALHVESSSRKDLKCLDNVEGPTS